MVEGEPFSEQQFSDPMPNVKGDPFAGGLSNPLQKSDDDVLRDSIFGIQRELGDDGVAVSSLKDTGGM